MNLYSKLQQRAAQQQPIRVGLIGAGKFGSMYLAQAPRMPGVHLVAIADLSPDAARANLARVGWPAERAQAQSAEQARQTRQQFAQLWGQAEIQAYLAALKKQFKVEILVSPQKSAQANEKR